ncbi:ComEA family DNA-binding protein [Microbacterium wangchenii]|uniref:ComEA family DNA-binding protein n=1 Tax=Microbacterium wangchenii TaxID=2541726 RepID=UPI0021C3970D|nr:ComEA family DNA-binding protein [Microbacterium wangchenii]
MESGHERGRARRRLGVGAAIVLVLAVFAVTVGIGIVRGSSGAAETVPLASAAPSAPSASAVVYVHVAGAVAAPGLYALEPAARAVDAIAAAGGFAPDADRGAVNLARAVQDGEQFLVPVVGAVPDPAAASPGDPVVDLNTADAAALEELPGIGPALADRILTWREENGRFASVEDLLAVPGIGEKLLAGLREQVRV